MKDYQKFKDSRNVNGTDAPEKINKQILIPGIKIGATVS